MQQVFKKIRFECPHLEAQNNSYWEKQAIE